MSTRQWTPEQLKAISDDRAELLVSAAAGSGKTAVLIERVRRTVLGISGSGDGHCEPSQRVHLERILVVTFTRAAAAELKARLRQALLEAESVPPRLVREQLAALARAQISTIHSFCAELVRRFGHTRGLSYRRLLTEDETQLLRHDMATRFLDAKIGADGYALREMALSWGGADGVGPVDMSRVRYAKGLREQLLSLLDFQQSLPDPERWYQRFCQWQPLDPAHFTIEHALLVQLEDELAACRDGVRQADAALAVEVEQAHPGAIYGALAHRRDGVLKQLSFSVGWEDLRRLLYAELSAKQDNIKQKPKLTQAYRYDIDKDSLLYDALPDRLKAILKPLQQWDKLLSQPWHKVAERENSTRTLTEALWKLAWDFGTQYITYKRERGLADYADLQRDALSVLASCDEHGVMLRGAEGEVLPSAVALQLRQRFERVLVDEHQDTNELQNAIIDLVTRDAEGSGGGRPRFVVGDLKQSIYTFRLAVPQLFADTRVELAQRAGDSGRVVRLGHNFRSQPRLIMAINEVFNGLMTEKLGGEDYAENMLLPPPTQPDRVVAITDYPPAELHLIPYAKDEVDSAGKLELAYIHLASTLQRLHDEGHAWRDMAILMRSTAGRIERLLSVCARVGVPIYAPGRSGFYERPEVSDALSLLSIIDNPLDEIALAAVLAGPAVGLDPVGLLTIAASTPPGIPHGIQLSLWERLACYLDSSAESELAERLAGFLRLLAGWRDAARHLPVAELLWDVYADTGLLAAMAGLGNGEQRVANLYALHELARQAGDERRGLARFLRSLKLSRRAAGDLGEAPLQSTAEDVVRVMTVHQSKGLEFPVVLIPDLDKQFNEQDLRGDVLWHRTCGIGGRHVDWPAPANSDAENTQDAAAPTRNDTLARFIAHRAKHSDLVGEELRILYVAMTRARERLVLFGAIADEQLAQVSARHAGASARCWLDWVAPQLAEHIAHADRAGHADHANAAWSVHLPDDKDAPSEASQAVHVAKESFSEDELVMIKRRLHPSYAATGSRLMPQKITVTKLAHSAYISMDVDATHSPPGWDSAQIVQPEFLRGDRAAPGATAAEIGSATHVLLEALDFRHHRDETAIGKLRDELLREGRLAEMPAQRIDISAVVRLVADLDAVLHLGEADTYPELPIVLLASAHDRRLLSQLGNVLCNVPQHESLAAGDAVYIQGIIDLLVVHDGVATVVDYKTDRAVDAGKLKRRYSMQLEWYCSAVQSLLPEAQVCWVIYGLGGVGLVGPVTFTPM